MDATSARIVWRNECADGFCPSGCTHLCWECPTCKCSGGFGATRERLTEMIALPRLCGCSAADIDKANTIVKTLTAEEAPW